MQTVEGDSTSASSLRSQLQVDPVRENENEGKSILESHAVFFLVCVLRTVVGCLHLFCFCDSIAALVFDHRFKKKNCHKKGQLVKKARIPWLICVLFVCS